MNALEIALASLLFALCVILEIYIGTLTTALAYEKYVFEATRHAQCKAAANSTGSLVVATCLKLGFNGTFEVIPYNITVN
ncbi:hypothetical protein [Pyrobaculum neutrophilum]|uniref:TadE family protein n=1 Tax=Pyrobaculum neutrophilum (strain DSM 2338 / JCM 9278 / NBRC 100436 / V24Sta) TaxID=444157 RepID=B1YCV0_PYRNV|nr:hypothetical protein [Pyrobaculum neutrophilum]ACB39613.1 conserved hypothetical protein [Pyrobaculum neutrophilum V24Sta]